MTEARQSAGEKRLCAERALNLDRFMFSPSCKLGNARRTIRAFGQGHVLLASGGKPIGKSRDDYRLEEISETAV